jgi:hypothetical protein
MEMSGNAGGNTIATQHKPNPNGQASAGHLDSRPSEATDGGRQKQRGIGAFHSRSSSRGIRPTTVLCYLGGLQFEEMNRKSSTHVFVNVPASLLFKSPHASYYSMCRPIICVERHLSARHVSETQAVG